MLSNDIHQVLRGWKVHYGAMQCSGNNATRCDMKRKRCNAMLCGNMARCDMVVCDEMHDEGWVGQVKVLRAGLRLRNDKQNINKSDHFHRNMRYDICRSGMYYARRCADHAMQGDVTW